MGAPLRGIGRVSLAVGILLATAAGCSNDPDELASTAETTESTTPAEATTSPLPETSASSAPSSSETDSNTTTSTTSASSVMAAALPEVVNPRWNPYDPNDFGEEFPSIEALGEVSPPASAQDQLAAAVYAANRNRSTPLGAGCSPGDGELGDGIWAAGIAGAGADTVTIDLVCLYPQQDDMFVAPTGQPCSGPFESGDPCMTNSSDVRRVLDLSPSVDFAVARLLEPAADRALADIAPTSHADFLTYLELGTYTPFLIEIRDGVVVRIEQYRNLWFPGL